MSEKNDLKQDIVKEKILKFINTVQDNKTSVAQYAFGICLIIIGFLYYTDSKQMTDNEAKILSGRAQNLYIDTKIDDAIVDFNNVIDAYPSTSSAIIAKFYLANDYMNNEMVDDALILFEQISSKIEDEVLQSSIFNKMGDIYLDKNELDEALNHYKKAANIKTTNSFKALYLSNIAKIYKLQDDYIGSIGKIEEILEMEDLKYNLKNEAQQLRGELDFLISR